MRNDFSAGSRSLVWMFEYLRGVIYKRVMLIVFVCKFHCNFRVFMSMERFYRSRINYHYNSINFNLSTRIALCEVTILQKKIYWKVNLIRPDSYNLKIIKLYTQSRVTFPFVFSNQELSLRKEEKKFLSTRHIIQTHKLDR